MSWIDNTLSVFFVQYLSKFLKPILNTLPQTPQILALLLRTCHIE